jgi:hypothetical protein
MAHRFGGVPLTSKMHAFQAEIGRDQQFVTGGNFEDGAVIPDTDRYASPAGSSTPDTRDQRSFGERHDGINYVGSTMKDQLYKEGTPGSAKSVGGTPVLQEE